MPMLYSSRQHRVGGRESLDCAQALADLASIGVDNIMTFDAHDDRVRNAIPLKGFDNLMPTYQMLNSFFRHETDIDKNNLKFSRIINVAGVDTQKAFMEYTSDKVLFQLRVNAEATICLTHALLNRREEKAELLTISSMSGTTPMPYFALYSATKDMLINFSKSLHYELKKDGVKVTVIMPGGVPTRQDIIEDIKGQGLWGKLASKSPIFVAEKSLRAVRRNKLSYIPGFLNRMLYRVTKILPQRIVLKFIANRWKKQTKDAF
jgi:short-subunit dehydrogenase